MTRQSLSSLLQIAIYLLLVGAAVTLIPWSAHVVRDLGYATLCPFAPWSTITLLFLAGLAWAIRNYANAQPQA